MKFSKKILSFVLATLILLGSVGIGGEGLDTLSVKASAANYTARTSAPSQSGYYQPNSSMNPFSINTGNCTWYVWGRWYEILGSKPNLCKGNAANWYGYSDGYSRGSTPKLGAIACWYNSAGGHVAVVEEIYNDGTYLASMSGYGNYYFKTQKFTNAGARVGSTYSEGTFQGYIYLPITFSDPTSIPGKSTIKNSAAGYPVGNVTFNWTSTSNTTHYNFRIWKLGQDGTTWTSKKRAVDLSNTSYTFNFTSPGYYYVYVQSYNSNSWDSANNDNYWTGSDYYYFVVYSTEHENLGDDFYAYIRSTQNNKLNVCASGSDVKLSTSNDNNNPNQIWHFVKTSSDNQYKIINLGTGRLLDVCDNSKKDGARILNYANSAQRWYVRKDGSYYNIVPTFVQSSNLDIDGGKEEPGTKIQLFHYNGTKAQWFSIVKTNLPTHSVNYNANGGSGAPSKQTKTYGKNLTLNSTNPTRTGYTFKNWNTKADGSGTSYAAGAAYSANSSVTLYAQWTENRVTVVYNSNYADISSANVDNAVDLSKNVKVKEGWFYYTEKNANGHYDYSNKNDYLYLGKTGYVGTGYWNTKADGTGIRISEKTGFTGKELAEMLGVNIDKSSVTVNLYPEWVFDHNHTYVTSTVAPTCSEKGYTLYTCSCGYSYKDNYIDALGHNYKYVYNNDATESRDGTETQICTRCGAKGTTRTKFGTKSGVAKIAIDGYVESVTLSYKSTLKLHSIADNMPDGAEICWVYTDENGEPQYYFGESLTLSKMRKSTAVVACVVLRDEDDAENSVVIAASEVINVQVKTGFFSKLIAFFRMLFGSLPEIELKSQYAPVTTARIKEETTTRVIVSDPNLGTTLHT